MKHQLLIFFLFILIITGCYNDDPNFPDEPIIELVSISATELNAFDQVTITLSFTDGNGDIGSGPANETQSPISCGFEITCDTIMGVIQCDTGQINLCDTTSSFSCYFDDGVDVFIFDSRDGCLLQPMSVGNLSSGGSGKGIEGELDLILNQATNCKCFGCASDTLFYTIQIKDRSNTYSNFIKTPTITLNNCP